MGVKGGTPYICPVYNFLHGNGAVALFRQEQTKCLKYSRPCFLLSPIHVPSPPYNFLKVFGNDTFRKLSIAIRLLSHTIKENKMFAIKSLYGSGWPFVQVPFVRGGYFMSTTLKKINDFLAGLPMTIVAGIFCCWI